MLITHQHPHNKSIMAGLLGLPNVGKSSLINTLLGFDLSIVTDRPQTTRNQFQCIFTIDKTEVILVDTPGIHACSKEINKRMNGQAIEGTEGLDLNLLLIDVTEDIFEQMETLLKLYPQVVSKKLWLVFNKIDLIDKADELPLEKAFNFFKEKIPSLEKYFSISTKTEENIHSLTGAIVDEAKSGPHLYPDGSVSNKNERFFAGEYIREEAFKNLHAELPYEMAVVIDDFFELKNKKDNVEKREAKIQATILVNRPSQRAIVVGSKGSVIRDIGTRSRAKIEKMFGGKVHLNLHVKVAPKWFKNNFVLEELGLPRAVNSNRVWRAKL